MNKLTSGTPLKTVRGFGPTSPEGRDFTHFEKDNGKEAKKITGRFSTVRRLPWVLFVKRPLSGLSSRQGGKEWKKK